MKRLRKAAKACKSLWVFESSSDVFCLQGGGNALVFESGSVAVCCFRFLKWRLFECWQEDASNLWLLGCFGF